MKEIVTRNELKSLKSYLLLFKESPTTLRLVNTIEEMLIWIVLAADDANGMVHSADRERIQELLDRFTGN